MTTGTPHVPRPALQPPDTLGEPGPPVPLDADARAVGLRVARRGLVRCRACALDRARSLAPRPGRHGRHARRARRPQLRGLGRVVLRHRAGWRCAGDAQLDAVSGRTRAGCWLVLADALQPARDPGPLPVAHQAPPRPRVPGDVGRHLPARREAPGQGRRQVLLLGQDLPPPRRGPEERWRECALLVSSVGSY